MGERGIWYSESAISDREVTERTAAAVLKPPSTTPTQGNCSTDSPTTGSNYFMHEWPARKKRILWLINHKTLIKAEAKLISSLGYEIFIPKIIPETGFRSGSTTFEFDRQLTILPDELAALNEFNFYREEWTDKIKSIINQRFAIAFVRPFTSIKLIECLRHFTGHVALRGFGNENHDSYTRFLARSGGEEIFPLIEKRGNRFSFAVGYEQLTAAEPPFLVDRAIYLPISMPAEFNAYEGIWQGKQQRFLTIIPDIKESPIATAAYEQVKSHFAEVPHVIAGAQSKRVDDPNVIGFVSDDELIGLYQESAAYFSPSRNIRHILYSPIEAAIIGQPIVCFTGTLLSHIMGASCHGCATSPAEAARLLQRLIAGDGELVRKIQTSQQKLVEAFSQDRCRTLFEPALLKMLHSVEEASVIVEQTSITLSDLLHMLPEEIGSDAWSEGWIDFAAERFPTNVTGLFGLSWREPWGRWSSGSTAVISFDEPLPQRTCLIVSAGVYDSKLQSPLTIRLGKATATLDIDNPPWSPQSMLVEIEPRTDATELKLSVSNAVRTGDGTLLGFGLCRLRVFDGADSQQFAPLACLTPAESEKRADQEWIDFRAAEFTWGVTGSFGFSWREEWGRWSDGCHAVLRFARPLPSRMRVTMVAGVFHPNAIGPITLRAGRSAAVIAITLPPWTPETLDCELTVAENVTVLVLHVANPHRTPDGRKLGIGLCRLRITDISGELYIGAEKSETQM